MNFHAVIMFYVVTQTNAARIVTSNPLASCDIIEKNMCFKNKGYNLTIAASPSECCDHCRQADQIFGVACASWTWIGPKNGECHLKATVPTTDEKQPCHGSSSIIRQNIKPSLPNGVQNIVLIVVDDLRPELGSGTPYNQAEVLTPRLDEFASTSLTFTQAYCQFSHCSPSRNSFLSGRGPQTTGVYNFIDTFREGAGENWTALPQWFKQSGFESRGGGKIYHPNKPPNNDEPLSWDSYYKPNGDDQGCRKNETIYSNVCPSDEPDSAFYDSVLVHDAVQQIEQSKSLGRPFFIGIGMRRPHRLWHVPKRFYDMYANNGSAPTAMRLAQHKVSPVGMPALAYINNAWPGSIHMNASTPIPDHIAALGRWGYYASVSFTDHNIGVVLDALESEGVSNNTIVVVTGDHGWELGEHAEWCKRTNFEIGLRVPMMIRSPAHRATSYGKSTAHFMEMLDLYRTLASLAFANHPVSRPAIEAGVEGVDLSDLFSDVNASVHPRDVAAFSQMARCPAKGTLGPDSACNRVKRALIPYMGYSVRVVDWRYTVWIAFNGTANRGVWGEGDTPPDVFYEELYSHKGDDGTGQDSFDAYENENVAAANKAVCTELLGMLKTQFDTPPQ